MFSGYVRRTKAKLDLYDTEQHKTLPEIGGYSATLAALDKEVYKKIQPLITDVYALDEYIGRAGLLHLKDRNAMIRRWGDADSAMVALEMQLPEILGEIPLQHHLALPRSTASVFGWLWASFEHVYARRGQCSAGRSA